MVLLDKVSISFSQDLVVSYSDEVLESEGITVKVTMIGTS